jgi:putative membrane protein
MKRILPMAICIVAGVCMAPVLASQQKSPEGGVRGDEPFMKEAAIGGLFEVKMGQVAAMKAHSNEVKQFGQRMVTDHSKANRELMDIAAKKGISLPKELDGKHQDMMDHLSKLSGSEFDREYISHMVKDHEEDAAAFEKEARSGQDAEVKAWAGKTLTIVREHLRMAQQIEQTLKGGAGGK